jgi:hypothetical protein
MVFKLDEKILSRDPAVQRAFVEDELCHDTGTLEGLAGNLDRAAGLDSGSVRVPADAGEGAKTRIWLSHGTDDGVCDYRGTQKVYDRLDGVDDKALKLYDEWYHKRKNAANYGGLLIRLQYTRSRPQTRKRMPRTFPIGYWPDVSGMRWHRSSNGSAVVKIYCRRTRLKLNQLCGCIRLGALFARNNGAAVKHINNALCLDVGP